MTSMWHDHVPQRSSPYLDWEKVVRDSGGPASTRNEAIGTSGERWCAVLIQLLGPAAALSRRVGRMRAYLNDIKNVVSIRITTDEVEVLQKIEKDILQSSRFFEADDVDLQFFVYMNEDFVNDLFVSIDQTPSSIREDGEDDTAFVHGRDYRIRLIGAAVPLQERSTDAHDPRIIVPDSTPFSPLRTAGVDAHDRKRVAIGIIDDGIGFAHERFRTRIAGAGTSLGHTRIQAMWLQDLEHPDPESPYWMAFGKRLMAADIDTLLRQAEASPASHAEHDVYRRAGLLDFGRGEHQAIALRTTHGTHVMDLAAGFDPDDPMGPARPILAVQLPATITADTSGVSMGTYVLQGLRQIMLWADKLDDGKPMPLVVNFSYGITAGPKDGWHILEQEIDRLVAHRNKRTPTAVVLPSGNSYRSRTTAKLHLPPGARDVIDWVVLPDDRTASFVEIWCNAASVGEATAGLLVTLIPPAHAGLLAGTIAPSERARLLLASGQPIAGLYRDRVEGPPGTRKTRVVLALNPTSALDAAHIPAPAGRWRIEIHNPSAQEAGVWLHVQRDDTPAGYRAKGRQSYFDHHDAYVYDPRTGNYDGLGESPITHQATLSAIGNGAQTVLVGGAMDEEGPAAADYSASGPTAGRDGPDFASLSENGHAHRGILGAGTLTGTFVAVRGTSVAAPQVTRELADVIADIPLLRARVGALPQSHPRLGCAIIPAAARIDIPARRVSPRTAPKMRSA